MPQTTPGSGRSGRLRTDHRPQRLSHEPDDFGGRLPKITPHLGINVRGFRRQKQRPILTADGILMPIRNAWRYVTSEFGWRSGVNPAQHRDFHTGIDFGVPVGTKVFATHAGYYTTEHNVGGGIMVRGKGGSQWQTIYAHLSKSLVGTGRWVSAGELIGYTGRSGSLVTGPHLHYEVINDGRHMDPRIAAPVGLRQPTPTVSTRRRRYASTDSDVRLV